MTDPQFRTVIRALEQREGVDILTAPSIMTQSGREANLSVQEQRTYASGVGGGAALPAGGGGAVGGGAMGAAAAINTAPTTTVGLFGPLLNVVPYVLSDGFTIQLALFPQITEFLGYDDPGPFLSQTQIAVGNNVGTPLTSFLPLPRIRTRSVTTAVNVWDGRTVMLGGLITESVTKIKDKVPLLGDTPLIGRFFRSESMSTEKKNLVIFVTATQIDPAGRRIHSPEEMPFNPPGTTSQRSSLGMPTSR